MSSYPILLASYVYKRACLCVCYCNKCVRGECVCVCAFLWLCLCFLVCVTVCACAFVRLCASASLCWSVCARAHVCACPCARAPVCMCVASERTRQCKRTCAHTCIGANPTDRADPCRITLESRRRLWLAASAQLRRTALHQEGHAALPQHAKETVLAHPRHQSTESLLGTQAHFPAKYCKNSFIRRNDISKLGIIGPDVLGAGGNAVSLCRIALPCQREYSRGSRTC